MAAGCIYAMRTYTYIQLCTKERLIIQHSEDRTVFDSIEEDTYTWIMDMFLSSMMNMDGQFSFMTT